MKDFIVDLCSNLYFQDCTVPYCTVLYYSVLYCTVLYCTVLYCTVLYCRSLEWLHGAGDQRAVTRELELIKTTLRHRLTHSHSPC